MHNLVIIVLFGALLCALHQCLECPSGCRCFADTRTVKCVSKDLRAIPQDIPGYTRNVIITGNNIFRIGSETFQELKNVTTIILSNNGITQVASHSFSTLSYLRYLDMSCNHLALIHPEALNIPGSPLKELNLSRSLYNYTSLTDLTTALRWGGLGGLLSLDLSGNCLVFLPPGMFSHLPGLQHLLLGNNSLASVYNGTFFGLRRLELLDLTSNSFRVFGSDALGELERLVQAPRILLSHNPYVCTCEIQDFAVWLKSSRAQVGDAEALTCASPWEFQDRPLQGLGVQVIGCHVTSPPLVGIRDEVGDLSLQTSYVLLGLVLGFVGMVFLFVLYLNRQGIKKWVVETRDACHDVLEGYQHRYEIDTDPRREYLSKDVRVEEKPPTNGSFGQAHSDNRLSQLPTDTCLVQISSDTQVKPGSISVDM
ncbi:trophoblast glycoprotein-like [Oncorhynchus keta]|uniref:trophoblast glycoprotein-like n=1 Tax=Oncorhynchus keta TaxID=8018 RepID=UPI00227C3FFB|nr:trophoblast glycoprotein-like [Oncorhynchus keta]